jgi:hypothetical protein
MHTLEPGVHALEAPHLRDIVHQHHGVGHLEARLADRSRAHRRRVAVGGVPKLQFDTDAVAGVDNPRVQVEAEVVGRIAAVVGVANQQGFVGVPCKRTIEAQRVRKT